MENSYVLRSLLVKNYAVVILLLLTIQSLRAQTAFTPGAPWDYGYYSSGSAGTVVHNNGVVQLLSNITAPSGEAASVHETTKINTGTSWSICYNVFFGCPGTDNIGSDIQGDGMAWSLYNPLFSACDPSPSGGYKLGSVGGGLGYSNTGCSKIITIEFDTYSSQNTGGYDQNYGGTATPSTLTEDEISLQIDGHADNTGILFSSNPGNLEDGLQHTICISYTPSATLGDGGIMQVTIDGSLKFSYDLGSTYNLEDYFDPYPPTGGTGVPPYTNNNVFDVSELNQMWSSGKQNAYNASAVAPAGIDIAPNLISGTTLCPATVTIAASAAGCSGDYSLSSTVVPPTGCTTTKVDFYDGTTLVGTDATSPYSVLLATPAPGNHDFTAKATFSGACGTLTSNIATTNVGSTSQMQKTTTPINVTDGSTAATIDATWASYPARAMNYKQNCWSAPANPNDADIGATFKVIYDDNFLYLLVDVTDDVRDVSTGMPDIWNNDAVEIFLDGGKNGGYSNISPNGDAHYIFRRDGSTFKKEDHGYSMTDVTFNVLEKGPATGYYMEIKISWATLGTPVPPTPGSSLGFDISVGDADNNTGTCSNGNVERDNIITWNDSYFDAYGNISRLGTLNFSGCDPLPVELLSVTAVTKNATVVLDWVTASEQNNYKFVIERSEEGSHWIPIGEVMGAGNTNSITEYTFTDVAPLNGTSYYRLRQIDINGSTSVSKTLVILNPEQRIRILPNPFEDILILLTTIEGNITVSLYDVSGRLLYETDQEAKEGILTIHPELATGAYIMKVRIGEFMEHYPVIKK